jgi:hypothetical protein
LCYFIKITTNKLLLRLIEKYKGKTLEDLINNAYFNKDRTDIKTKNAIAENSENKDERIAEHAEKKDNEEKPHVEKERTTNPEIETDENKNKVKLINTKFIMLPTIVTIFRKTYHLITTYMPKLLLKSLMDITTRSLRYYLYEK